MLDSDEVVERASEDLVLSKLTAGTAPFDTGDEESTLLAIDSKIRNYTRLNYAVALSNGCLQLSYYPILFYFKQELGRQPHDFARFKSVATVAWSIVPLIAYFEDSVSPWRSRVKSWMIIGCLLLIGPAALIVLFKPDFWPFTLLFMVCNFANVIHDVLAQGNSVILLNLHRQKAEIEARLKGVDDPEDIKEAGKKGEAEGKKAFGNYFLTRFIIRTISGFTGGVLASYPLIRLIFFIIICMQSVVLAYSIFVFKGERSETIFNKSRNLWADLGKFYRAIRGWDTLLPLIMLILIRGCPECSDAGTYILNDIMGWTGLDLSYVALLSGVIFYLLMVPLVNKAKTLGVKSQVAMSAIAGALHHMTAFRFLYYQNLSYLSMLVLSILSLILSNIAADLVLFAIVGRFSLKCPKGLEGFGVNSVSAFSHLGSNLASLSGAQLLHHYKVNNLDYSHIGQPFLVSFGFACFTMLLSPFLGR